MEKRGQAWGFDIIIATIIFLGSILLFFTYSINLTNETESALEQLNYDGNKIAESLLSEGVPISWNISNVQEIGLITNNKIDEGKLSLFYEISTNNYDQTKSIFNTRYNYYIYFSEPMIINNEQVSGIGLIPSSPVNLVRITRFTIYQDKPVTLNIEIWE